MNVMELFILIISLIILAETSVLTTRRIKPNLKSNKRKVFIDTSVLIDGRILNIAKTGFLNDDFIILKSVLKELQLLADGRDSEKRAKARAGLETASALERIVQINTTILDDGEGRKVVDEELLRNAKSTKGAILTLDYNLIKVAEAEKVTTLNLNDLAIATRREFLPGEKLEVKVVEKGSGKNQGIAYLSDGTMLVVDRAASKVNQVLNVELIRFYETSAGKMIFAKPISSPNHSSPAHRGLGSKKFLRKKGAPSASRSARS